MATRERASRQVLNVTPSAPSAGEEVAGALSTAAAVAENFVTKRDEAKMNNFAVDAQIQMIEATRKWQVENESNPTDKKAMYALDKEYNNITEQYNDKISGFNRGKWQAASSKLKNQMKMKTAEWGVNQEIKNAETNISDSIKKNLDLAYAFGESGDITSAKQAYEAASAGQAMFADGVLGAETAAELTSTFKSDFMKSFVDGQINADPEKGEKLLNNESVVKEIDDPEEVEALKKRVLQRKKEIKTARDFDLDNQAQTLADSLVGPNKKAWSKIYAEANAMLNIEGADTKLAKKVIANLKSQEKIDAPSNNQTFTELNVMIDDINTLNVDDVENSTEFLRSISELRGQVLDANTEGKLNTSDYSKLLLRLNSAKQSKATRYVADDRGGILGTGIGIFDSKDADTFFKTNAPAGKRYVAFREYFEAIESEEITSKQGRKDKAQEIVDKMKGATLNESTETLKDFDSVEAADSSGLKKGTIVTVGGRRYRI